MPWHILLLAYGSGVAAQNLNITPGGFGITEGTLSLTLATAGLRASQALAAVLLYRLVSFWLVAGAGWLTFLWLRAGPAPRARHKQAAAAAGDAADTGSARLQLVEGVGHHLPRRAHAAVADAAFVAAVDSSSSLR